MATARHFSELRNDADSEESYLAQEEARIQAERAQTQAATANAEAIEARIEKDSDRDLTSTVALVSALANMDNPGSGLFQTATHWIETATAEGAILVEKATGGVLGLVADGADTFGFHGLARTIRGKSDKLVDAEGRVGERLLDGEHRVAGTFGIDDSGTYNTEAARLHNGGTDDIAAFATQAGLVESNGRDDIKASSSSATGRYQIIEQTWYNEIYLHGDEHGGKLAWAKSHIHHGLHGYYVDDTSLKTDIDDMRKDNQYSRPIYIDFVRDNAVQLHQKLHRDLTKTDLYMASFFGEAGAAKFLLAMQENPNAIAVNVMGAKVATGVNHNVFYAPDGKPRTLGEIYAHYQKKFPGSDNIIHLDGPKPSNSEARVADTVAPTYVHPATLPVTGNIGGYTLTADDYKMLASMRRGQPRGHRAISINFDPSFAAKLVQVVNRLHQMGWKNITLNDGVRDDQDQAVLKSRKGKAGGPTVVAQNHSEHFYGFAADLGVSGPERARLAQFQRDLAQVAREYGLKPGADFNDPCHIMLMDARTFLAGVYSGMFQRRDREPAEVTIARAEQAQPNIAVASVRTTPQGQPYRGDHKSKLTPPLAVASVTPVPAPVRGKHLDWPGAHTSAPSTNA